MKKEIVIQLQNQEWYSALVEECQAIITEAVFTSRWALVEGYWKLGERISEENDNFKRQKIYGEKIVQQVAESIDISSRTIHYALQAYRKYPELGKLPEGKNLTWKKLITEYLPEPEAKTVIELPKGKYSIIYADPAWEYDRTIGQGVAIEQYELMPLDKIKSLPVNDLAAEDSILFLWATFPKLVEALETINAWGFEYKTVAFTWIKTNKNNTNPFFGIGSYFKSNAEVCLLATKGEPHKLVKDNSLSSVILSPLQEHSKKPVEARKRIEKLVGKVKMVELFAREKADGWASWGNEI